MTSGEGAIFHVQSAILNDFIAEVQRIAAAEPDRTRTVTLLRPAFARILGDKTWLPDSFTQPDPTGGMGSGVGNYLIYRSAERDLSLMSLVLPPGASTPVHDHLAWGLVGLYSGEQEEWVYRRTDANGQEGTADLVETEQRHLQPGDFYELLPPEGDIHRVRTLGDEPSVSLHLLGNDIGCIWRHRYEPEEHRVHPFRSGYSNEACLGEDDAEQMR
jgi:predicted metal-dependent enzyme (double-stranded beta helix superfamily)